MKSGPGDLVGDVLRVFLLMAVLSVPGWYVTTLINDGTATGGLIGTVAGAITAFVLVGIGAALFFGRKEPRAGTRRAVAVAVATAALYLAIFLVADTLTRTDFAAPTAPAPGGTTGSDNFPWSFVIVLGPALLLAVLTWAGWRNNSMTRRQEQMTETGARKLREEIDAERARRHS